MKNLNFDIIEAIKDMKSPDSKQAQHQASLFNYFQDTFWRKRGFEADVSPSEEDIKMCMWNRELIEGGDIVSHYVIWLLLSNQYTVAAVANPHFQGFREMYTGRGRGCCTT